MTACGVLVRTKDTFPGSEREMQYWEVFLREAKKSLSANKWKCLTFYTDQIKSLPEGSVERWFPWTSVSLRNYLLDCQLWSVNEKQKWTLLKVARDFIETTAVGKRPQCKLSWNPLRRKVWSILSAGRLREKSGRMLMQAAGQADEATCVCYVVII